MSPLSARRLLSVVTGPSFRALSQTRTRTPNLYRPAAIGQCRFDFSAQRRSVASIAETSNVDPAAETASQAKPISESAASQGAEPPKDKRDIVTIINKHILISHSYLRKTQKIKKPILRGSVYVKPSQTKLLAADTMQRNFDTFAIPHDIQPVAASIEGDNLHVTWSHENHLSVYPLDFICDYIFGDALRTGIPRPVKWTAPEVENNPPTVQFDEVMNPDSEEGMAKLTRLIQSHGFAFVSNTPVSPDETKRLLEHIGPIRNTHYGGFYDFIPDLALADTAYTNLALPAHTDTTYFTEPAGLQAFHLLSHQPPPSAPSGALAEGGKSLLVDGFKAAATLKEEDPFAHLVLSTHKIPWHASGNKGIAISPAEPFAVLERDFGDNVARVRWNNDDRGVLPFVKPRNLTKADEDSPEVTKNRSVNEWYRAARKWNEIIKRKNMEYWVQLTPGNVLIFDNWRVLHGRSAFEGVRRICGGYINRDDFISRWRNTNFPREKVIRQVVG